MHASHGESEGKGGEKRKSISQRTRWTGTDGREFPSVGGEEEVNGMVVELGFGAQIRVDHLADRCRPV